MCKDAPYWLGCDVCSTWRRVIKYAKFVEAQHDREEAPGCEMCANNRVTLEKAWQVDGLASQIKHPHQDPDSVDYSVLDLA